MQTFVDGKKVHQENERKRFGLVEIIDEHKKIKNIYFVGTSRDLSKITERILNED